MGRRGPGKPCKGGEESLRWLFTYTRCLVGTPKIYYKIQVQGVNPSTVIAERPGWVLLPTLVLKEDIQQENHQRLFQPKKLGFASW